jgi:hypothetical protein
MPNGLSGSRRNHKSKSLLSPLTSSASINYHSAPRKAHFGLDSTQRTAWTKTSQKDYEMFGQATIVRRPR